MIGKKLISTLMAAYCISTASCGSGPDSTKTVNPVPKSKSVRVYDMGEFRNDFFKIDNEILSFDGKIALNSNAATQIESVLYQSILSVASVDHLNYSPIAESHTTMQDIDLENDRSLVIGACSSLDDMILDYHHQDISSCEEKVQQEGYFISGVESFDETGTSTGISVIIAYDDFDQTSIDSAKDALRNFLDFKTRIFYSMFWDYDFSQQIPYPLREKQWLLEGLEHYVTERPVLAEGIKNILVVPVYSGEPLPEDLINTLRDPTQIDSFGYCGQWFENQARLWNINLEVNFNLSADQYRLPPELLIDNNPSTPDCYMSTGAGEIRRYLTEIIPNSSDYDAIVPLYYSDTNTITGCFDNADDRSFIMFIRRFDDGRFSVDNTGSVSGLACHELSHVFGSEDKYTSDPNVPCMIENFGGDITCTPKYDPITGVWKVPPRSEIVITDVTAAELGWTDFDGDGMIGIYDPKPFNEDNSQ